MFRNFAKAIAPDWAKQLVRARANRERLRAAWLTRSTHLGDDHLNHYWNSGSDPNRAVLVDLTLRNLPEERQAILEYGCHVGINLKLIHDGAPTGTRCFAVEPNQEAFDFLKSKLSFVEALNAEDEGFLAAKSFPPSPVGVSFANSVFYSMTHERTAAVISKLALISDVIIIGDAMDNCEGRRSKQIFDPVYFQHPYRKMLDASGFSIRESYKVPAPQPQLNGILVAART